jgi:hypothetical protein
MLTDEAGKREKKNKIHKKKNITTRFTRLACPNSIKNNKKKTLEVSKLGELISQDENLFVFFSLLLFLSFLSCFNCNIQTDHH